MMGRWRVEASDDGSFWIELASFFNPHFAFSVFSVELARERRAHLRLVSPDGTVHERARLRVSAG